MRFDEELQGAVDALARGLVVVVPTDTVYGVAARPDLPDAIDRVFELKGRERRKALPVLGYDINSLRDVVDFDDRAALLAESFWPGPLTLVLARKVGWTHDVGGGTGDSVAVRVPAADETRELLRATGSLAVTSANRSGEPPLTTAAAARELFGDSVAVYLDGGPSRTGAASTVVSLVGELSILRAGPIDESELRQKLTS